MKITVRLDDITPDMNWEKFYVVKKELDYFNIKPLIGIVPDNRDVNLKQNITPAPSLQNYREYIQQLVSSGWTAAMHGYQHIYQDKKINKSEFSGLDYAKQYEMLSDGYKKLNRLCNGTVLNFFAPANNHDATTIKVIKDLGIKYVSYGKSDSNYEEDGVIFIPICDSFRRINQYIRFYQRKEGVCTVVLHTNTMDEKSMLRLRKCLKHAAKYHLLIDYSEAMKLPVIDYNSVFAAKEVHIYQVYKRLAYLRNKFCKLVKLK